MNGPDLDDARVLRTPHGTATLDRRPIDRRNDARAWDGADRLLVDAFHDRPAGDRARGSVLIVGDSFGALAVLLRGRGPVVWSDSATSHLATIDNLAVNNTVDDAVNNTINDAVNDAVNSTVDDVPGTPVRLESDEAQLGGPFDVVVWKLPRSARMLQHQASVVQHVAADGALVLAAGMDKHVPPGARAMLERLGATSRRPGAHKAHVYELLVDRSRAAVPSPRPSTLLLPELGLELEGDASTFSPEQLDLGTRVMLGTFDRLPACRRIADLGCGNGILGIELVRRRPGADVHFFDDSFASTRVARRNVEHNIADVPGAAAAECFHWTDGMHAYDDGPFDLIVCNPPFHHHGAVTDAVAWQLFVDARAHLAEGGELRVVGNRHLGYHAKLQRLFGNCRQLAAHPKFVVLAATRVARDPRRERGGPVSA